MECVAVVARTVYEVHFTFFAIKKNMRLSGKKAVENKIMIVKIKRSTYRYVNKCKHEDGKWKIKRTKMK